MKISNETFKVLKNYQSIKNFIEIDEPDCLKMMDTNQGIVSLYRCSETFPNISFYSLDKFNNFISAMGIDQCEFEFNEDHVEIVSGSRKIKHEYGDTTIIDKLTCDMKPSHVLESKEFPNVWFKLSDLEIKELRKMNGIFGFNEKEGTIKFELNDGVGLATIFSDKNSTKSNYSLEIEGEGTGSCYMKISSLCMLDGNYKIFIGDAMTKWVNENIHLIYFIFNKNMEK